MTLQPIDGVRFSMVEGEKQPVTFVTIKNTSEFPIVFKVKTTQPDNYVVNPNFAVVKPSSALQFKITFNHQLDSPVSSLKHS